MDSFKINQTLKLTVADAESYFLRILGARPYIDRVKIQFPAFADIREQLTLPRLTTPWDSPNLMGLRISLFNNFQLRLLERGAQGVIYSQKIQNSDLAVIYKAFCENLQWKTTDVLDCAILQVGPAITLAPDEVTQLFISSLVDEHRPRLAPRVQWPADADLLPFLRKYFLPLPWKATASDGSASLEKDPTTEDYVFKAYGERGSVEHDFHAKNLDDVLIYAFNAVTRRQRFENDQDMHFYYVPWRDLSGYEGS